MILVFFRFFLFYVGFYTISFCSSEQDGNEKNNIKNKNTSQFNSEISSTDTDEMYYNVFKGSDSKFIINDIFIKGCSERHVAKVKSVLTIKEGDLINLKSSSISTNIKRILSLCDFVDEVQCFYKKSENNEINIFFYITTAPLIVDFEFYDFKSDKIEERFKKTLGKKYATSTYLGRVKKAIMNQLKDDGEENYEIFIRDSHDLFLKSKSEKEGDYNSSVEEIGKILKKNVIEIKCAIINNENSIVKNIIQIMLLDDKVLKNIFEDKYHDIINIIRQFRKIRLQKLLKSSEDLTDEEVAQTINKDLLDEIIARFKNKPLVKLEINREKYKEKKKYIKSISFEGNNNLKSDFLMKEIKFFNHGMSKEIWRYIKDLKIKNLKKIFDIFKFYTLTKSSYKLNEEIINLQKQKIIECYLKKGFINAEVIRVELNKIVGTDYYHVTYFITEGKQFFINNISFSGNKTFTEKFLRFVLGFKKGDVFDIIGLKEKITGTQKNMMMDGIKSLYSNEGFLESSVQLNTSFVGNKVDLFIDINEGEKSKIGIVKISGNKFTEGNYFKHFIYLYPGEDFKITNFIASQQSLARSDVVDKDQLLVLPTKNKFLEDVQDIYINVKEKLKMSISGGLSTDYIKDGGCCCNCAPKISGVFNIGNLNLKKFFHLSDRSVRWFGKQQDFNLEISANPTKEPSKIQRYRYSISSGLFLPNIFGNIGTACGFSLSQYHDNWDDNEDINSKENEKNKEYIRSFHFYNKFVWSNFNRKLLIKIGLIDITFKWNKCCCCKSEEDVFKRTLDIPLSFDIRYSTIDKSFFVTRGVDFFYSISFCNPLIGLKKEKKEEKYIFETRKYIQCIIYFSWYKTVFSKNIVFNMALYGGFGYSFSTKKTNYLQLSSGPIETYFSEGDNNATVFFLKAIDEDNFLLKYTNKCKNRIAFKTNIELRFKVLDTPYFGICLFGFFNGGNLYWHSDNTWYKLLPQNKTIFSTFNLLKYSAAGIGVRLNIPIMGVWSFHCGFDISTKEIGFGLTFRQDFELIF